MCHPAPHASHHYWPNGLILVTGTPVLPHSLGNKSCVTKTGRSGVRNMLSYNAPRHRARIHGHSAGGARHRFQFFDRAKIIGRPEIPSRSTSRNKPAVDIRPRILPMPVGQITRTACPPKRVNR
ncbi:hypothetical protein SL1157_0805 [Ruegeria lacuscaerulensis ITI-1157]|nr:hypothetical protein SL1157_0805 [Ruegeria lacuscaerulensis ITI-1157]